MSVPVLADNGAAGVDWSDDGAWALGDSEGRALIIQSADARRLGDAARGTDNTIVAS